MNSNNKKDVSLWVGVRLVGGERKRNQSNRRERNPKDQRRPQKFPRLWVSILKQHGSKSGFLLFALFFFSRYYYVTVPVRTYNTGEKYCAGHNT
jgi:hypothetical protein